ncbi:MAG: hypothetical protein ABSH19_05040, partial [Opitutales bacterium]
TAALEAPHSVDKLKDITDEDNDPDLEKHALTLDSKTKRRIVIYAPSQISKAELERIQKWLSFQLIVSEPDLLG